MSLLCPDVNPWLGIQWELTGRECFILPGFNCPVSLYPPNTHEVGVIIHFISQEKKMSLNEGNLLRVTDIESSRTICPRACSLRHYVARTTTCTRCSIMNEWTHLKWRKRWHVATDEYSVTKNWRKFHVFIMDFRSNYVFAAFSPVLPVSATSDRFRKAQCYHLWVTPLSACCRVWSGFFRRTNCGSKSIFSLEARY